MELIAKELPNLDSFKNILSNNGQKNEHLIDGFDNYLKFLFLIAKYPQTSAVPTKQIDAIWHSHLKNEDLYNQDCLNYFGEVLDTTHVIILMIFRNFNRNL